MLTVRLVANTIRATPTQPRVPGIYIKLDVKGIRLRGVGVQHLTSLVLLFFQVTSVCAFFLARCSIVCFNYSVNLHLVFNCLLSQGDYYKDAIISFFKIQGNGKSGAYRPVLWVPRLPVTRLDD